MVHSLSQVWQTMATTLGVCFPIHIHTHAHICAHTRTHTQRACLLTLPNLVRSCYNLSTETFSIFKAQIIPFTSFSQKMLYMTENVKSIKMNSQLSYTAEQSDIPLQWGEVECGTPWSAWLLLLVSRPRKPGYLSSGVTSMASLQQNYVWKKKGFEATNHGAQSFLRSW
jgi:hypothetical protein